MNHFNYSDLLLGYAETDITPNQPVQLMGFYRADNTSQGVRDPLYAQVSVWKSTDEYCCLIAIDHIGFSKKIADRLRNKIADILSVSMEKVMLCFSHTHAAPSDEEEEYNGVLFEKICKCVKEAVDNLLPVFAAWGNIYGNIGFNRRKESDAVDRRIGILKVTAAESEEVRLIILRLTAHANVLKRDNYFISADYFGEVRKQLKEKYRCPVMVTQGASGNIAPRYVATDLILADANDERVIRSEYALEEMAGEIADKVGQILPVLQTHAVASVKMFSRKHKFEAEVLDCNTALEIVQDAMQQAGITGEKWLSEIHDLNKAGIKTQSDIIEIHFFIVDNGCLCGIPNEIMCEVALHIWHDLQNEYIFFGGYTNGCGAYFPTEEEFDLGGYEVYWAMFHYYKFYGRVFPLKRTSFSELLKYVKEALD